MSDSGARIRVQLPRSAPAGEQMNVFFQASRTPSGWLGEWDQQSVPFPDFAVKGTTRDVGAIAVKATDDLVARLSQELEELHTKQDPEVEKAAVIAAACLATVGAAAEDGDPFAHGSESGWWQEGLRVAHGRFPR